MYIIILGALKADIETITQHYAEFLGGLILVL